MAIAPQRELGEGWIAYECDECGCSFHTYVVDGKPDICPFQRKH